MAAAGTGGALFGMPATAALVFSCLVGSLKSGSSLWHRPFSLLASTRGAITANLIGSGNLSISVPSITSMQPIYSIFLGPLTPFEGLTPMPTLVNDHQSHDFGLVLVVARDG